MGNGIGGRGNRKREEKAGKGRGNMEVEEKEGLWKGNRELEEGQRGGERGGFGRGNRWRGNSGRELKEIEYCRERD